jgi:hypothetical protein
MNDGLREKRKRAKQKRQSLQQKIVMRRTIVKRAGDRSDDGRNALAEINVLEEECQRLEGMLERFEILEGLMAEEREAAKDVVQHGSTAEAEKRFLDIYREAMGRVEALELALGLEDV